MEAETDKGSFVEELRRAGRRLLPPGVMQGLFLFACGMWLVYQVISTSFYASVLSTHTFLTAELVSYYTTLLVVICELGKLAWDGYDRRDAYALVVVILMAAGTFQRGFSLLSDAVLLVFCARSFDVRKVVCVCAIVVCCTFLFVVCSAGLGVIADYVIDKGAGSHDASLRHCLGFLYPLYPAQYVFALTCAFCYLREKRLTMVEGALALACNVAVFVLTDARWSFALGCLLVVLVLVSKTKVASTGLWARLRVVGAWSFPIAAGASVVVTALYGLAQAAGLPIARRLNDMLGYRLQLGFDGLVNFGVTTLGQQVQWQGHGLTPTGKSVHLIEYNYVDNMFLHLLVEEGWIYVVVLVALLGIVSHRALREKNDVLLLVMAITAAHCLLDDLSMYLHYDLILFTIATLYPRSTDGERAPNGFVETEVDVR